MPCLIILLWLFAEIVNITNHSSKKSFGFDILAKYTMLKVVAYLTSLLFCSFEVLHDTGVYNTFGVIIFFYNSSIINYRLYLLLSLLDRCYEAKIISSVDPVRVRSIIILLFISWWTSMLVPCRLTVFTHFEEVSNQSRHIYMCFLAT